MADTKLNIIISAVDKASGVIKGIGGASKSLAKIGAIGLAGVATGIAAVGAAAVKLAADAAPLQGVQDAFNGINEAAGIGGDAMLDAMKKGSAGMITNRDLMLSFNKAAQLVSVDFAQKLPEAMEYVGKVAASTGQDFGYLMDSLTTGVGRLSPMILDNLGITVDAAAAYDAYAKEIGKTASELSKQEQQTALMNQVMEKLAENTKDMPDIAGSAQQAFVGFGVALKNAKDTIGLALLPVITPLLEIISSLAAKYLPLITEWFKRLLTPITWLVMAIQEAGIASVEVQDVLASMFGEDIAQRIMDIITWVQNLANTIRDFVNNVLIPFVQDHLEEFKGALIAIGVLLAAGAIIAGIMGIISVLSMLLSPLGLIIAAVALLGAAWAGNWFGMRDTLTEFWENTAKPKLEELRAWLEENIPIAIETAKKFWEEELLPALETVWAYIKENVIPILDDLSVWVGENLPVAIETLTDFWENTLYPALESIWKFLSEDMMPIWEALVNYFDAVVGVAIEVLAGLWENILLPAMQDAWDSIKDTGIPVFGSMSSAADTLAGWIGTVAGMINDLADAVSNLPNHLPEWLRRRSPSEIELTFIGLAKALKDVNMQMPRFATSMMSSEQATGSITNSVYNVNRGGISIYANNSAAMALFYQQQRQEEYERISDVM